MGFSTVAINTGRPAFEAASLSAWWHGASADRLDSEGTLFGVLASEIADGLPGCAAQLMGHGEEEETDADLVLRFPGP